MDSKTSFDLLLECIKNYYHNHGYYPKVRISIDFWEEYAHEIADLAEKNISINVVDNIRSSHSFLLEKAVKNETIIDTLSDLKSLIDRWIQEGKGSWPIRSMAVNADIYVPIQLHAIIPGEAPPKGLELMADFPGAPDGEHILVVTGE